MQEIIQQFFRVLNPIRVLTQDPNHGSFRIGILEDVQILTQRSNDPFVLVRVASEDVFDDDYRFLYDVGDFRRDEREEYRDANVGRGFDFDR